MARRGLVGGEALLASAAIATAVSLVVSAAAVGHPPSPAGDASATEREIPRAVARAVGEDARRVAAGLYEVPVRRGPNLLTHGPDIELASRQSARSDVAPGGAERPPACASDHYQHVLYARPSWAPDRLEQVKPSLQAALRRANAVLNEDSLASGGGTADFKVLCDSWGQIRVDSFASRSSDFGDIVAAARAAGYRAPNADYTIFFDHPGGGACGIGSYETDERLTADNANNFGGGYAVMYAGCWYDETPMHEIGHNQGAVQYGAPNSTGSGGHCYDELDAICYSPDGGELHQAGTVSRCADRMHFDCGADDYFDTSPEAGEYLATHWNLGSPLNRFIALGPQPAQVERLRRRMPREGFGAAAGEWRLHRIRVPSGRRSLRVALHHPQCGSDRCDASLGLYVRRGTAPMTERPGRSVPNGRVRIRSPRRGTWYIGVRTVWGREGAPFTIRASY